MTDPCSDERANLGLRLLPPDDLVPASRQAVIADLVDRQTEVVTLLRQAQLAWEDQITRDAFHECRIAGDRLEGFARPNGSPAPAHARP